MTGNKNRIRGKYVKRKKDKRAKDITHIFEARSGVDSLVMVWSVASGGGEWLLLE